MKRLAALILLCSLSLGAQASLAMVNWSVGDRGTTRQQWLFDTNANPALPETDENPYGDAVATISNALNPAAFSWSNGVWSGSAFSLTVDIPNNPVANPYKEVLVEVVYRGQIVLSWVMDNDWNDFLNIDSYDIDLGGGWMKRVDLWQIEPNPSQERLCYGFKGQTGAVAMLDSILIDTICAPEPVTVILLGLGALVMRKSR